MSFTTSRLISVLLIAMATTAFAAPPAEMRLANIERKILKEPTYSGTPRYLLLVFGPEAKTRV